MSRKKIRSIVLPSIPNKRYFSIGEVSVLCGVEAHVLRYWEQEFSQLKLVKRRANRRYYQPHDVMLIRKIRSLLYEQGFTISGARYRLEQVTLEKATLEKATEYSVEAVPLSMNVGHKDMMIGAQMSDKAEIKIKLAKILSILQGEGGI